MAMLLMFIPLQRLTSRRAVAAPIAERVSVSSAIHVEITATAGPFPFVLKHLGNVVWKGEAGPNALEHELSLPFPPEGIELGLEGALKDPTQPAAVKLKVVPANGFALEKVVWATGSVDEVLTFQP